MKVLKRSDRIKVTVSDLNFDASKAEPGAKAPLLAAFYLAPLTMAQKAEIKDCRQLKGGVMVLDGLKASALAVKYSLKDVEGLEDSDGQTFKLEFTDNTQDALTDDCVESLLNAEVSTVLMLACSNLIHQVYSKLTYPDGIEIPNVEVEVGVKKK